MFPNLIQATKEYWHQLDQLEAAYRKGEIPLEKVDAKVANLIAELAAERRTAFNYFWQGCLCWIRTHRETVVGLGFLVIVTYTWAQASLIY